jgi:hypothetical protein
VRGAGTCACIGLGKGTPGSPRAILLRARMSIERIGGQDGVSSKGSSAPCAYPGFLVEIHCHDPLALMHDSTTRALLP